MNTRAVKRGPEPFPERAVLDAVEARLPAEARRRLGAQRRQMAPVRHTRVLPEATLLRVEPGEAEWSPRVLFPRREEFVLATVDVRSKGGVHSCEVVAVNGRIWAVLASPPLPPAVPCQVDAVRLGANPMAPCRPGGRRLDRPARPAPGGWTLLEDTEPSRSSGSETSVVAVHLGGTLLVGRRDRRGGVFRALAPGRPPVTLRARRLEEALPEASRLTGA